MEGKVKRLPPTSTMVSPMIAHVLTNKFIGDKNVKERDMSQTISDVFVEHLVQAGVQRIYGIVGDSLNPVVDAVRRNGKLKWIHVRHEEEAAFAAGAEDACTPWSCRRRCHYGSQYARSPSAH